MLYFFDWSLPYGRGNMETGTRNGPPLRRGCGANKGSVFRDALFASTEHPENGTRISMWLPLPMRGNDSMKRVAVALLIALLWTGTVSALGVRVCACSGDQLPITSGLPLATRAEVIARAHQMAKNVTDAQLSVQQLRNAQLQERLFQAQIRKENVTIVLAVSAAVAGAGVWAIKEWGDYCERVDTTDHTTLVCPF